MTPLELEKVIQKRDEAQRLIDIAEEKGVAYITPIDHEISRQSTHSRPILLQLSMQRMH